MREIVNYIYILQEHFFMDMFTYNMERQRYVVDISKSIFILYNDWTKRGF